VKTLKKLLILNSYPYIGGAEKFITGLSEGLSNRGWKVFWGLKSGSEFLKEAKSGRAEIYALPMKSDFDPTTVKPLFSLLRNEGIRLIFATDERTARIAGTLRRMLPNTMCVARLRSVWKPGHRESRWKYLRYKLGYRLFLNHIVTNSAAGRDDLVQDKWFPAEMISVIYNGLNLPHMNRSRREAGRFRTSLELPEDAFVVTTLARKCPPKNQMQIFEIAAEVIPQAPDIHFVIAGKAVDAAYGKALAHAWQSSPVKEHIHLLGHQEAVQPILIDTDVLLSTSLEEGLPNVFIEAGFLGKPVVARDICGNREIILDGQNGILLPAAADSRQYAEALLKICRSPELAEKMGRFAHRLVEEKFSYQAMIENYHRLFSQTLKLEEALPNRPD